MIGVVAHERRKVERHREPRLSVCQKKLVALVRVTRASEARELAHGPQAAPVAAGVDASRVRIEARHTERRRVSFGGVQRSVDGLNFFGGICERDVAQLALLVFPSPVGHFPSEKLELRALLLDRRYQLLVGGAA